MGVHWREHTLTVVQCRGCIKGVHWGGGLLVEFIGERMLKGFIREKVH